METEKKIISKDSLAKLYEALKSERRMFAPVESDGKIDFRYNPEHKDISYGYIQTVQSAKNVVFPRVENLFSYKKNLTGEIIEDIDISAIPEVVLWSVHPCDAASFMVLKTVFEGDFTDQFFKTRMDRTSIISLSCKEGDAFCFCNSTKSGPADTTGSDILLIDLGDGHYLAKVITEKGKVITDKYQEFFQVAPADLKEPEPPQFQQVDVSVIPAKLSQMFEDPFWMENSLRCIGCGACVFVCPICSCFDIQDETKGKNGKRLRCWDSCGFSIFTMHASGHNPRSAQSHRWRQRIMHKFKYIPDKNDLYGCVGCGRCSRACPVDMNILEQLIMLSEKKIEKS